MMKKIFSVLLIFFCSSLAAQNRFIDSFAVYNTPQNRDNIISTYTDGNSYRFMTGKDMLNGWLYMYMATKDTSYSNFCKRFIDSLRSSAQVSNTIPDNVYTYKDEFYGWTSRQDNGTLNTEVPLYESYISAPVFLFFRYYSLWSNDTDWIQDNKQWFETNMWTKWKIRSQRTHGIPYRWFLRGYAHDGAHWAIVATVLTQISDADTIRAQANEVVSQFDILLQRNLNNHPDIFDAYIWNGGYDDVSGTQGGTPSETPSPDDVSHANHVAKYMYFAGEMGNPLYSANKNRKVAALAKGLYKEDGTFWDILDLTMDDDRPGNWGNYQADGWVLFAKYDTSLFNIYKGVLDNYNSITKNYNQAYAYPASLALVQYNINNPPDTARKDTTNNIAVLPFRKTIAVPDETVTLLELDNVKGVASNGNKYRIIRLGENQSSFFGVYSDDNTAERLQAAFDRNDVGSILLSDDTISTYNVGKIDAHSKVLKFTNGAKITSADTLSNLVIDANTNTQIISGSPVFVNLKTNDNKFYAAWVGVKGDGGNYVSRLNYAIGVAASNGLTLELPAGTIYADAHIIMQNNMVMSGNNTTINLKQNTRIAPATTSLHDVKISNLNITIVDTSSGTQTNAIYLIGSNYGIKNIEFKNIRIDANRKASSTVRITQVDSVVLDNVEVLNSAETSIDANFVKRLSIKNSRIINTSTNGILVYGQAKNTKISNVIVQGVSVNRPSGSSYGISVVSDSTGNEIDNVTINIDSSSNSATTNYAVRLASPGMKFSNSTINVGGVATTYIITPANISSTSFPSGVEIRNVNVNCFDKVPNRIIYPVNVNDLYVDGFNVNIDKNVTGTANAAFLYTTGPLTDSVNSITLNNINLSAAGKFGYLLDIRERTSSLSVNNLNIDSLADGRILSNADSIINLRLTGINIKSGRSGAIITVPATVKSFLHTSSNYIKGDTLIASVNGSVSSKQESIYVNGRLLWEDSGGGSVDLTPVYDSLSNHNARIDSLEKNDTAYLKNVGSGYKVLVAETDTTAQFKSFKPGANVTLDSSATEITINAAKDLAPGDAGTDSLVVVSGGVLKRIAADYYLTSGGGITYTDGVTNSSDTVRNDLITGKSGGQTVTGGTASGDDLTLRSTSHSTKGKINFGASHYDEANNVLQLNGTGDVGNAINIFKDAAIRFYGSAGTATHYIYANAGAFTLQSSKNFFWGTKNSNYWRMDTLGRTLISYNAASRFPSAMLDLDSTSGVYAPLRIAPGKVPSSRPAGVFYVKDTDNHVYYYDGTNEYDLTETGESGGSQWDDIGGGIQYTGGNVYVTPSGGDGRIYMPGTTSTTNYIRGVTGSISLSGGTNVRIYSGATETTRFALTTTSSAVPIGIGSLTHGSTSTWLGIDAGTTSRSQFNYAISPAPSSPTAGDGWYGVGNQFNYKFGARFYGKLKVDTIPNGTAGTDSILVTSGGEVRKIPGNSYVAASYLSDGEYRADTIWSSPTLQSFTRDTLIYTVIGNKVHVSGRLTFQTKSTDVTSQQLSISLPPSFVSDFPSHKWLSGGGTAVGPSENIALDIRAGTLNASGGALIIFPAVENTTYTINFNFLYKYIPGGD